MASTGPICLVRGSLNIDEFYHVPDIVKPGQTISATSTTRRLGGKGLNQACAAASAGAQVILDGAVGAGTEGATVIEELKSVKGGEQGIIDVGRIRREEGFVTGKAVIQLAADGENSIIILAGANFSPSPAYTPLIPPDVTHLLLANEIPFDSSLTYLRDASSQGVTTIYNPSPMPSAEQLKQFDWKALEWLIVNEGELEEILRVLAPSDSSAAAASSAEELAQQLHKLVGVNVICTLGAKGVVYCRSQQGGEHQVKRMAAAKLVKPLTDTTGAGDCFLGYFAAGLMQLGEEGGSFEDVIRRCLTACAICVESHGAKDSYPMAQLVEQRMAQSA